MKELKLFNDKLRMRIYDSWQNRNRAISQLERYGYNYFVAYFDTQGYGLQYTKLEKR